MAYVKNLFDKNFLEYASYVIRDRAIPDLEDGLKPVQRRIIQTLFNVDDGRFHKVAGVVGDVMKLHPHGDASIYGALVVLENKGIFIEGQGNFGNMFTGDDASAARYIECRILPLAKDFLYNPHITNFVPSYDGRNKEPVVFRAKLPVALIIGAEGIAVGMSTKILSYNIKEVIEAEIKALKGENFAIYPDVATGGLIDVTNYNDGNGKIITRAKLDMSDEKKIVITELPVDCTSESLLSSIENAARLGRIKISSIQDLTTDHAHIEIKLPRGVYAQDVEKALYAFTDCEKSISCQMLVIKDNMPVALSATEIIHYYAKNLTCILKDELCYEKSTLKEELHARTLERIFIEERIYKQIEQMKTEKAVNDAVKNGFEPFASELIRAVTDDDVARLLKIPIRRISLFDINKNRDQVKAINARLKEIEKKLKNLTGYAIEYLTGMLEKFPKEKLKRRTTITKFSAVDVRSAARSDISLRYDDTTGYIGTAVASGRELMRVSQFDRIFVLRRTGTYTVCDVPQKLYVDKNMWFCCRGEKDVLSKILFTIVYKDPATKFAYIKRCRVEQFILNRDYVIVPDGMEVLHIDTRDKWTFTLHYEAKPRIKITQENFCAHKFEEKGLKAQGVRLASREVASIEVEDGAKISAPLQEESALQTMPLFSEKNSTADAPAKKSVPSKVTPAKKVPATNASASAKPLASKTQSASAKASGAKTATTAKTASAKKSATAPKKSSKEDS